MDPLLHLEDEELESLMDSLLDVVSFVASYRSRKLIGAEQYPVALEQLHLSLFAAGHTLLGLAGAQDTGMLGCAFVEEKLAG